MFEITLVENQAAVHTFNSHIQYVVGDRIILNDVGDRIFTVEKRTFSIINPSRIVLTGNLLKP